MGARRRLHVSSATCTTKVLSVLAESGQIVYRIPEYFARPSSSSSAPVKKKRRVLQRTNREEGLSSSDPSVEERQVGPQSVSDSEVLEAADVLGSTTDEASTSLALPLE